MFSFPRQYTLLLSGHCYMSFILVSIFVTAHFYREKGSIFIHSQNQRTIASFCVNSKVVSSDFSMMKNIIAPLFLSSFQ